MHIDSVFVSMALLCLNLVNWPFAVHFASEIVDLMDWIAFISAHNSWSIISNWTNEKKTISSSSSSSRSNRSSSNTNYTNNANELLWRKIKDCTATISMCLCAYFFFFFNWILYLVVFIILCNFIVFLQVFVLLRMELHSSRFVVAKWLHTFSEPHEQANR